MPRCPLTGRSAPCVPPRYSDAVLPATPEAKPEPVLSRRSAGNGWPRTSRCRESRCGRSRVLLPAWVESRAGADAVCDANRLAWAHSGWSARYGKTPGQRLAGEFQKARPQTYAGEGSGSSGPRRAISRQPLAGRLAGLDVADDRARSW